MSTYRFTCLATTALGLVAVANGVAPGARAQSGPAPAVELDAVTVTATRTETRVFDYPGSTTVIDAEKIEQTQPSNLGDLLDGIPGVDMSAGPRAQGETPLIRGLGGDRILIRVDGARRNLTSGHDGRVFIDPDLLKQVEIVRGPASSIYGSGAIGGVIELVTKDAADFLKPGETAGAQVKVGYQSAAGEHSERLTAYGRFGDAFDAVASAAYKANDDIRQGTGADLANSSGDEASGFFKLGWTPNHTHSFTLSGTHLTDESEVPVNPQSAASSTNPVSDREVEQRELTLSYRYQDPGNQLVNLKANVYRNEANIEEIRRTNGTNENFDFDTQGLDVQNTSSVQMSDDIANRFVYGGEVYQDSQEGKSNGGTLGSRLPADALSYGAFLQDEITLFDRLTVIPGLRYDHYQRESSTQSSDTVESALSPKVAVGWRALDWLSFHGGYSHSFRAPSFIELYVSGQHFFGNNFVANPDLRPEKAKTWEGGFGLQFKDLIAANDDLKFKTTYFDEVIEDFIELVVTQTTSTNQNRAEVNRRGAEAELSYSLDNLALGVGYSAVRAEDAVTHDSIDSTPADQASVAVGYRVPASAVRLRWNGRYVFAQERTSPPGTSSSGPTSGYMLHGIGLTWEPDVLAGGRLDLGVDNLFDVAYRRHNASLHEAGRNIKLTYTQRF